MLGGGTALGSESQSRVERHTLACNDRRQQLPVLCNDHVLQRSELPAVPLDGAAPQLAEPKRAGAVEVHLVLLEEDERRWDPDLVTLDGRRRQRQETMHLVAAEKIEPDRPSSLRIEKQVDRATKLDAV